MIRKWKVIIGNKIYAYKFKSSKKKDFDYFHGNLNRIISKKDGIISINPFLNQTYAIYGVDGNSLSKIK